MKTTYFYFVLALSIGATMTFAACTAETMPESPPELVAEPTEEEIIQRGEYLVAITGCNDCHSPKRMGANGPEIIPELMLSGYPADRPLATFTDPLLKEGFGMFYPDLTAAAGPWGMSFAANLTPSESGTGSWSLEQFTKALTEGKAKGLDGGRMLLPPMPWMNYVQMEEADVEAIYRYLQSIPAVDNVVPAPIPPTAM